VYKQPKSRHGIFRTHKEDVGVANLCQSIRSARKLKTLAFGLLEPSVFSKVAESASLNPYLEDMTFTINSCANLSKTVEKFSQ